MAPELHLEDWRHSKPRRGAFRHANWLPLTSLDQRYGLLVTLKWGVGYAVNSRKGPYRHRKAVSVG
jgi:hypothetical protein